MSHPGVEITVAEAKTLLGSWKTGAAEPSVTTDRWWSYTRAIRPSARGAKRTFITRPVQTAGFMTTQLSAIRAARPETFRSPPIFSNSVGIRSIKRPHEDEAPGFIPPRYDIVRSCC